METAGHDAAWLPDGYTEAMGTAPSMPIVEVQRARALELTGSRRDARAVYDKRKAELGREDPEARCLPPGVPRMSTTPYPWSFLQTPKEIWIVYEGGAHIWRKIFMDGRPHDPKVEQTWLGDSIGHWEGDTLVVETVGQNDITWIDAAGIPHSPDMKVTERITLSVDPVFDEYFTGNFE